MLSASIHESGIVPSLTDAIAVLFKQRYLAETPFAALIQKELVELDMESMQTSSLALLEEVSMVGEMLPELPLGDTDNDVAEIGMSALLVASSVERVVFVRVDEPRGYAEVSAQIAHGADGVPRSTPYQGTAIVADGDGLVWRAARSTSGPACGRRSSSAPPALRPPSWPCAATSSRAASPSPPLPRSWRAKAQPM